MITRRQFLLSTIAALGGSLALGGYAFGIEPGFRLRVQRDTLALPGWRDGLRLRLALIADLHACDPWMNLARIRRVVETANALEPDAFLPLGDHEATHPFTTGRVMSDAWAGALAGLGAPLGVHAVLGTKLCGRTICVARHIDVNLVCHQTPAPRSVARRVG